MLKGVPRTAFQKGLGVEVPKDLDQGRHQPGPRLGRVQRQFARTGPMRGGFTGAATP